MSACKHVCVREKRREEKRREGKREVNMKNEKSIEEGKKNKDKIVTKGDELQ